MKKIFAVFWLIASIAHASCPLYYKDSPLETPMADPLYVLLQNNELCPANIQELKHNVYQNGLQVKTSMVANRGRLNPIEGSFSFFESIAGTLSSGQVIKPGDFFLGYFTALDGATLILDQEPKQNKLLIEIIAWDSQKGLYNFYELRGLANGSTRWFYRGDSEDAYKDNKWLYRTNPPDESHFGKRMRCSACHNSGGPILKELVQPHNDWWTSSRPLLLEPNNPDADVAFLVENLTEVDVFAKEVQAGAAQLTESNEMIRFHSELSWQEQLRPLFCTTEINIESSPKEDEQDIQIPSAFWINPLLGSIEVSISRERYNQLLQEFDMHFPETLLRDADHSWHTPVKGQADLHAIKNLIKRQVITEPFAKSVLMIDIYHPLFSSERCELLKLVPKDNSTHWLESFKANLQRQKEQFRAASELFRYLNNPGLAKQKWNKIGFQYEELLRQKLNTQLGAHELFERLIELRKSVYQSDISQNPLGQILEPGFRVIFPESLFYLQTTNQDPLIRPVGHFLPEGEGTTFRLVVPRTRGEGKKFRTWESRE